MTLTTLQYLRGAGTGSPVGFSLGLVGGGGSILAVPLMVYFVGVTDPHVAIGTSALAVAANARQPAGVALNRGSAPRLVASGGATGLLSGFFGVGGGFLVVAGLMASTRMPTQWAHRCWR